MRTIYFNTLFALSCLASARAISPTEVVASPKLERGVLDGTTWSRERLKKARNRDLDGAGLTPRQPESTPGPSKADKTVQLFWEIEPGLPPILTHDSAGIPKNKYWWYFYVGEAGIGSDPCNSDPIDTHFEAPKGKNFPTVVNGEWEFDVPDLGKCKYQGIGRVGPAGDNGWLHCPDRPAIMCKPDERPIDTCDSDTTVLSKAISYCDW